MQKSNVLSGLISLYSTATILSRPQKLDRFSEFSCFNLDFEAEYYGVFESSQSCVNCRGSSTYTVFFRSQVLLSKQSFIFELLSRFFYNPIDGRYLNASQTYKLNREWNVIRTILPRFVHFQKICLSSINLF